MNLNKGERALLLKLVDRLVYSRNHAHNAYAFLESAGGSWYRHR